MKYFKRTTRRDQDIPDEDLIFRTAENGKVYAINKKTGETSGLGPKVDKKSKKQNSTGRAAGTVSDETRKQAKAHYIDIDETQRTPKEDCDWKTINPNVGSSRFYNNNCGYCSVAYELIRRGMKVTAGAINGMRQSDLAKCFNGFKWHSLNASRKTASKAELDKTLLDMGNGARGIIFIEWDGRTFGHYFNFEVADGKVLYLDGQEIEREPEKFFERCKPSKTQYARTDHLELNDKTFECVKGT